MTARTTVFRFLYASILATFCLSTSSAVGAGKSAEASKRLEELTRALESEQVRTQGLEQEAQAIDEEMVALRKKLVHAAKQTQAHEAEVARLETQLAHLIGKEATKLRSLKANHGNFAQVLLALARLARHPPEALIAQPLTPTDTVRSALLLRTAVPRIENRAKRLRQDVAELLQARRDIAKRKTELSAVALDLDSERAQLDELLAQKSRLRESKAQEIQAASLTVQKLAGEARNLRELLDRLERERRDRAKAKARKRAQRKAREKAAQAKIPKPARKPDQAKRAAKSALAGRSVSGAKGRMLFPVVGSVSGRYGQSTKGGLARKGITIRTRSGAQVVAPYDGQVVYADNFRGYGRLLIIEHSEGYHTLLAGLGRIDGVIGQSVVAGEPVGVMGRPDNGRPALYVELRRNGQPINPLPWLAARKDKEKG